MWNAKGMSKAVLAIALVLVLLVQVGMVVAEREEREVEKCGISGQGISAEACYRRYDGGNTWRPYACVTFSCTSDRCDHTLNLTVEMQHNGKMVGRGTGTGSVSYWAWLPDGDNYVTAIGSGYCDTCGTVIPFVVATDAIWDAVE